MMRRLGVCLAGMLAMCAAAAEPGRSWDFEVLLDGTPIGRHRFELSTDGDRRTLVSRAAFTVKLLGIPVYRYRHEAREQWRGDCLTALDAHTDDGGERSTVRASGDAELLRGCVMTYAYWHPAMLHQTRLLNAQTGKLDAVRITAPGSASLDVRGQPQPAMRWRIESPAGPLTVWVSPQGDWLGLDATVRGTRTLSYRLLPSRPGADAP